MAVNIYRDVYCLLGLPFDAVNMAAAVQLVRDAAAQRTSCFFSTPNLNFLIGCHADSEFRVSVINSDLSIADGMPLLWTARLLGIPISERVAGSTFRVPPFAWYLQRHKADADRLATAALVMLGSSVLSSWGRYDRQVISLSSVTYASIYAL